MRASIRIVSMTLLLLLITMSDGNAQSNECIPIEIGDTVQSTIDDANLFVAYCFTGTADQNIVINMNATGGDLDPFLRLLDSEGEVITSNDDANSSLNSQIITILPSNQVYTIAATRYDLNEGTTTGDFELSLLVDTDAGTPDNRDQNSSSTDEIRSEALRLNNLGLEADAQGRYGDALDYYQQALNLVREINERQGEGVILNNIGLVYEAQGQYGEALDFYQRALAIQREVGDRAGEGRTLSNIGVVYDFGLNDNQRAIAYYTQAVEVEESILQTTRLDEGISSLAGGNVSLYVRLTTLLIDQNDLATALEYAERGRGILARDELRNSPIDFRANLSDQSLLDREEALRLAVISAQNRVNALNQDLGASNKDKQQAQAVLNAAQEAYDQQIRTMQLQGGFLARELALDVATLDEIQASLGEDTTLLLYGVIGNGSYALLVTSDDLQGFTLNATTEQIEAAVSAFAADRRANAAALSTLYDLVFAPIADQITTSNLIISPDGVLNYVPFAALQAPDGSYLIDDYIISMNPSGTVLVLLAEREEDGVATAAGLALAQSSAPSLPTLQNANSEAQSIATILGGEVIINATEAALRDNVAGNAVVHISAHAELNPFAPLFSTIHLAEGGEHDGRLEVREIYELDLSQGTELVILSGCETGSGGTGEDFGLLNRAFLATGAETVVSSLWTVEDAATAELLMAFIEARESGLGEAAALRQAMLETQASYPDPYYWASFTLTGQP